MYGTVEELEPCTVCGAVAPRMVDIEVVDAGAPPWPLVPDPAWTSTVAPSLPFLQWHEHVALRLVGMTTLEMPASPFFSLFLRTGGGHAKRYNAARGIVKYDEGDWRDDRAAAGKVRRVTYEVDVVDDASRSRRVAVHETQSIVPTADGYVYEARTVEAGCEAVARAAAPAAPTSPYGRRSDGGPAYYTAERWVVAEQRGLLRAHAKVSVYAAAPPSPDGPGGGWTDEAHRRFDAWHAVATRETYANAVGAMVSDSVFGTAVGGGEKRKQGDAEPRPFVAPVPPSRVDFMTQLEEPPLVRERAPAKGPADEPSPRARGVSTVVCVDVEERGDAAKPAKKSGLGCGEAPWAAGAVPVLEKTATPSKRASWLGGYAASLLSPKRASGSTYEIVFDGVVGLQFADLGTGALVDGHEGYGAADAPPGVGSALTSVNGVRVGGLTFQSAMALAGQRKRPLALGFLEATPDALVDTLLVERTIGGCDARAVDAALAAPGAKDLRAQLDTFVANFNAADLRRCAYVGGDQRPGAMFKRAVDFAVDQLREKKLLASGSPRPQQNKTAALRVSRRDDDAEERDDAYWASCRKVVETRLAARVADAAWGLSPEAGAGDDELRVHFHSLRFLRLEHLGVVVPAGKARGQTSAPGREKSANFPTSKAPLSAGFHSFRLIFGRAIIPRNGLEACMSSPERARAEHSRCSDVESLVSRPGRRPKTARSGASRSSRSRPPAPRGPPATPWTASRRPCASSRPPSRPAATGGGRSSATRRSARTSCSRPSPGRSSRPTRGLWRRRSGSSTSSRGPTTSGGSGATRSRTSRRRPTSRGRLSRPRRPSRV